MPRVRSKDELAAEIAANTEQFSAMLVNGDGAAAARVYADDAVLVSPTGDVISGRDAIERFWQSGLEIGLREVELEPQGRGGGGSAIYEHGRYRMLLAPAAARSTTKCGAYVVVHIQTADDGSWHWAVSAFGGCQHEKEER